MVEADPNFLLEKVMDSLYNCAASSKKRIVNRYEGADRTTNRWYRIKEAGDSKTLWKGIDWNGKYRETTLEEGPPEAAFQEHLERLLNPSDASQVILENLDDHVTIPVLDDPFTPEELLHVIDNQIKPDKSCDMSGLAPGVLKLLPTNWLAVLLVIFNLLFIAGTYPVTWTISKLIMLFKKGAVMNCGNYRGITIMNILSKCYDYLIHNRLMTWFQPSREQAGAQPKRGCAEHYVALRLIIDLCMKLKMPLYIAFIDFSKAYDRVPRTYLLNLLKKLGCGKVMLAALASMYMVTKFSLGDTLITALLGVKQGSPSSCFLFILFVDEFVRTVKEKSPVDGLLGWLHLLVLMDDTVIIATSHEQLCQKLNILADWCNRSGMVINEDKTKYMSFNSSKKSPIILNTHAGIVTVSQCTEYTYLGCIITSDGKISSSVDKHVETRGKAMNKLVRFLDKNENAPFDVKKKVVDACFNSSLLYGCESWLEDKAQPELEQLYMKGLKSLLGVRSQTTTDVVLLESGYPSLRALIKSKQKAFFQKLLSERRDMTDDPFMHMVRITQVKNRKMSAYLEALQNCDDFVANDLSERIARVRTSQRTKSITYYAMNPTMDVHPIYQCLEPVDDYLRMAFTRFRTSSHRLRIETGRWSRTPRERRTCQCGEGIQSEEHVLVNCSLTTPIRQKYGIEIDCFQTFVSTSKTKAELKKVHEILKFFENLN